MLIKSEIAAIKFSVSMMTKKKYKSPIDVKTDKKTMQWFIFQCFPFGKSKCDARRKDGVTVSLKRETVTKGNAIAYLASN